ncbi:ABC transporter permease [Rhodococcoides kyotonense]|uniref:Peptide/nickel transport system permease protein n=1 Tax=Rhodococcoides kyotonense TaxID=398843 RepID=A0A239JFR7_9NOCA|nr:ABC transporter permease [Rhodococcus kyotonensis]SNT03564.1 peptide/nickel transport system permease protein [Rhodococcus kyotonensis]
MTTTTAIESARTEGVPAPSVWAVRLRAVLRVVLGTVLIVVPVFLFSTLITFLLGATSGLNPAAGIAGDAATPETIARIDAEFGLDKPVWAQYTDWMSGVLTGDLGVSWFNRIPVSELIGQRLAVSASIAGLALVIGLIFGVGLGLLAAVYRGSLFDRAVTAYTSVVSTLPPFVISIGLILVFSVWLGWLPSAGYVPLEEDPGRWLMLVIMPAVALSMDVVADIARQLRTGLVAELDQNYIVGAVVRGISPRRILFVHALRNGAGPALAILGMKIPTLIGGAVVMETMFSMPGFGRLAADSALRGDVPIVQGTLVVAIVFVLVCNIVVNITQGTLQPAAKRRE